MFLTYRRGRRRRLRSSNKAESAKRRLQKAKWLLRDPIMACAHACINPRSKATAEPFACEVAPARRRVSQPPQIPPNPIHNTHSRTMPVLSFPLHNPGSVPRRINGEVIPRRGVLFLFFFLLCLVTFLVCFFVCLSFFTFSFSLSFALA